MYDGPIIDSHIHFFLRPEEAGLQRDTIHVDPQWWVEEYLELMSQHQIERAALIGFHSERNPDINPHILDVAMRYPGKFICFDHVDLRSGNACDRLADLNREFVRGISFYLSLGDETAFLADDRRHKIWAKAEALGLLVSLNVDPLQAPVVAEIAHRYPGLGILLCHMGRPNEKASGLVEAFDNILALAAHPNIFVKVSGAYAFATNEWDFPLRSQLAFLQRLRDSFGSDRLLWASDFPVVLATQTFRQSIEMVATYADFLSEEDMRNLFYATAHRLIWKEKTESM